MEKDKKIVVNFKVRKEILKLGSYPTIRKALEGDTSTPQKMDIRAEALKLGGRFFEIEIDEIKSQEISGVESCSYE